MLWMGRIESNVKPFTTFLATNGFMKTRNALLAMLVLGIVGAIALTPTHAALQGLAVYARTDKSSYIPGDSGTLFITVRNQGTSAFTVKNITVTYPWKSFLTDHWDGNFTDSSINQALATSQTVNKQYTFTVPSDGRASNLFGGTISISVGTSEPSPGGTYTPGSASIQYAAATYQPVGLATSALPIVEIALLGIVVVMLALVWMGISKLPKK
jgi:hypothetical protein